MKKFLDFLLKYKAYVLIFSIVLLGLVWFIFRDSSDTKATTREETYIVQIGDISNSIKVVWSAELVDEQSLRFTQQWEITMVYVGAWDKVIKWQTIAEIDATEAQNSIQQTKLSLENAKLQLKDILDWWTEIQLLQAENNLKSAKSRLAVLYDEYQKLLKESKKDIEDMKVAKKLAYTQLQQETENLNLSKKDLEIAKKEINKSDSDYTITTNKSLNDSILARNQYISDAELLLKDIDKIFGVSNLYSLNNDAYDRYLWAKNTKAKNETQTYWYEANNQITKIKNSVWNNTPTIKQNLEDLSVVFLKIEKSAEAWLLTVENSVTSTIYTESQMKSHESTMESTLSQSQNKISNINTTIANLETLWDVDLKLSQNEQSIFKQEQSIIEKETNLKQKWIDYINIDDEIDLRQKTYNIQITNKEEDIRNTEQSVLISEKTLEDVKKWWTDLQIAQARNSVENQKLSLANAEKRLENYALTAPFDGVVRKIDFKIWDNITNDEQKYVYIENPNLIQMTTLLDQMDIINIKEWQTVEIIFDAYQDQTLLWVVHEVDATPQTSNWVVSYQVNISLSKKDLTIYGGMTAKMNIVIEKKENILLVPSSFVILWWDKRSWTWIFLNKDWISKKNWNRQSRQENLTWTRQTGQNMNFSWGIRKTSNTWSWKNLEKRNKSFDPTKKIWAVKIKNQNWLIINQMIELGMTDQIHREVINWLKEWQEIIKETVIGDNTKKAAFSFGKWWGRK